MSEETMKYEWDQDGSKNDTRSRVQNETVEPTLELPSEDRGSSEGGISQNTGPAQEPDSADSVQPISLAEAPAQPDPDPAHRETDDPEFPAHQLTGTGKTRESTLSRTMVAKFVHGIAMFFGNQNHSEVGEKKHGSRVFWATLAGCIIVVLPIGFSAYGYIKGVADDKLAQYQSQVELRLQTLEGRVEKVNRLASSVNDIQKGTLTILQEQYRLLERLERSVSEPALRDELTHKKDGLQSELTALNARIELLEKEKVTVSDLNILQKQAPLLARERLNVFYKARDKEKAESVQSLLEARGVRIELTEVDDDHKDRGKLLYLDAAKRHIAEEMAGTIASEFTARVEQVTIGAGDHFVLWL
ncbi:MAG: hypothetical protein QNK37_11180 [Acidobacteriota bacterium]|nr:hypothetical protein [Acidobacteriota bacterium]